MYAHIEVRRGVCEFDRHLGTPLRLRAAQAAGNNFREAAFERGEIRKEVCATAALRSPGNAAYAGSISRIDDAQMMGHHLRSVLISGRR